MNKDFKKVLDTINECINLECVDTVKETKCITSKTVNVGGFRTKIFYVCSEPMKIEMSGHSQFLEFYNK